MAKGFITNKKLTHLCYFFLFLFFACYTSYFLLKKQSNAYQTNTAYAPYDTFGLLKLPTIQSENFRFSKLYLDINNIDAIKKTKKITLVFSTEMDNSRLGVKLPKIIEGFISIPSSTCQFSIHKPLFGNALQYKNPSFDTLDFYLENSCEISNNTKQLVLNLKYSLTSDLALRVSPSSPPESLKNSIVSVSQINENQLKNITAVAPTGESQIEIKDKLLPLGNFIYHDTQNKALPIWSLISHAWGKCGNIIVIIGYISFLFALASLYALLTIKKRYILYGSLFYFFLGTFWASISGIPYSGNDEVGHVLSFAKATSNDTNINKNIADFTTLFVNTDADRIRGRVLEKYLPQNTNSQHPSLAMSGDPDALGRSPTTYTYWKLISHIVYKFSDPGLKMWLIRIFNVLCFTLSFIITTSIIKYTLKTDHKKSALASYIFIPLFAIGIPYYATYVSNYIFLICFPYILSVFCYLILKSKNHSKNIPDKEWQASSMLCVLFGATLSLLLISSTQSFPIVPLLLVLFAIHIALQNYNKIKLTLFLTLGFCACLLFNNKNYFSSLQGRLTVSLNSDSFAMNFLQSNYFLSLIPIIVFIFCILAIYIMHILIKISHKYGLKVILIPCIIVGAFLLIYLLHFLRVHMHDNVYTPARSILFGLKNVMQFIVPFFGFEPIYNVSLTFWTGFGTLDAIAPSFISKISIYLCSLFLFFAFFTPLFRNEYKTLLLRGIYFFILILILFLQAYAAMVTQNFMQGRYLIPLYLLLFSLTTCGLVDIIAMLENSRTLRSLPWLSKAKYLSYYLLPTLFIIYMFIQVFCYSISLQRYFYV